MELMSVDDIKINAVISCDDLNEKKPFSFFQQKKKSFEIYYLIKNIKDKKLYKIVKCILFNEFLQLLISDCFYCGSKFY